MAGLTQKEIRHLSREIEKQGLTYTELQQELLDHLCCDVEAEMEEGLEFVKALEKVKKSMGEDRIREIQEETLLLIYQKYRVMKKLMYILGIIAPSLLIMGTLFKTQHWFGAGVLIVLSLFLLGAIYLPVFISVRIRDNRKAGKPANLAMHLIGMIAGIIFIAGAMFKIQHWPGASVMILLSAVVTVAVFIPLLFIQAIRDKERQVQNFTVLIFVLCFVAITFMMYALRVSKNVLTAFSIAAEGHIASTEVVEARNAAYFDRLEKTAKSPEETLQTAREIREETGDVQDYIQDMVVEMVLKASEENRSGVGPDGRIDFDKVDYLDNLYSVKLVIFGDEGIPGRGDELVSRIEGYREFLKGKADPATAGMIDKLLDTSRRDVYSWLEYCFLQAPLIGAVNVLTSVQSNIMIAEGEVLARLAGHQKE
jgi:hypothetical protein